MTERNIQICQAAEDWVHGYSYKEIAAMHDKHVDTIKRWKKTEMWQKAVAGRVRQKRKTPVRVDKREELKTLRVIAYRWVALGKPSLVAFADEIRMPFDKLKMWSETPYWELSVLQADHEKARKEKRKNSKKKSGENIPYGLLKKAVFFYLSGWSTTEIGFVVNRTNRSIKSWTKTAAWEEMIEEVLMDQLAMHILHRGITVQEMYQHMVSRDYFTGR